MEKAWKITNLFIALVLIGLCSGFPIGLENSAADYHTQFLTGLVGVLLTVCGVVFLAGCLCCQRKNGFKEFHNNPVVASSTSSLDHGHINPIANGEFTIFTPLSPPHHNNNVFLANEQIVGQAEIDYNHADIDVHSWFDGTESDFPRTKLKYIKELGKGWFGRVVEGTAQGLNGNNEDEQNWTPVAVRILEASATSTERAVFLQDATIYRCGKHAHILQLLGRSLESVPLLLLQELCPRGDLKKYLRDNRGTAEKLLSSELPLLWCCQLSSALKHLHDHRLTHPDLATRNCQIVADLSLKLGDYGLAASLYPEDYYQGAPAVPVRWCSPESLTYTSTTIQPKLITFESNVWSLGVTMWEIYECGAQPYPQLSDDDVISQVLGSANVRLPIPDFSILYTDYIFRLMQLCWSTSESRPSVSQVYLMLTDLMQVYQNTKHITHTEPLISLQDFDKRWETFKPNCVARTDNHEFVQESISLADVDLSDITVLNMNLSKDEELSNTKPMSPSLNNLHGSLDNLAAGEMDSWLQKVANKTGDMSYVRGLSEAIKDLDNTLALENVSSSDSSHQPSPAPENLSKVNSKLEFKLGPTAKYSNDADKTQNSSLTESVQRTSSESETEDENWRRKIEQGAYSQKVQQKSKSVTDLMVLTHIDSESDSETPLPSLDYRVNYRNVRYVPKQNLENVSLMFGSEGNLLSVHDKFQEELRRLQGERKDSLLFVPEFVSHSGEKPDKEKKHRTDVLQKGTEQSSSDEETWTVRKNQDTTCTYVNTNNQAASVEPQANSNPNKNVSPNHRNPESLIEELSSPTDIQPGNQVYNIFNVTVDANFSPMHLGPSLNEIICYKDLESIPCSGEDYVKKDVPNPCFQVPKLTELIQSNDDLMDYIIAKYESQEQDDIHASPKTNISEIKTDKELNNNIQNSTSTKNIQTATKEFLQNEQQNYEIPKVQFDVSITQVEVSPSSMTHSTLFSSTPFTKRTLKSEPHENTEILQFSSNFSEFDKEEEEAKTELKYSLETWDNFLGKSFDGSRECSGFDEFSSEPQSLLFVDENTVLNRVECKNITLIESLESQNDVRSQANVKLDSDGGQQNQTFEKNQTYLLLNDGAALREETPDDHEFPEPEDVNTTFAKTQSSDKTFSCEDKDKEITENLKMADDSDLDGTYTMAPAVSNSDSNWEPGEGWFLHPQANSEVSGEMEVSQGGDTESYVGFSMDDEIMAAIRNELLMKLPQAQGQSSEQIRDSDEWDSEGRSEVLIKYNLYTTPLSPIPEESYSENDSHHFIYNREDSSDSENGDWPEPYEEHNSGLPDTETRSVQNAESPVQEPLNRHTPSQDSCCSNDTLFNLEELTYVMNENESLKISADLAERKGCDLFEADKTNDVEERTLKIIETETGKIMEQNDIMKELHPETKDEKKNERTVSAAVKKPDNEENLMLKKTNLLKTEVFTCSIEPTTDEFRSTAKIEEHTKFDENTIRGNEELKNIVENFIIHEKNGEVIDSKSSDVVDNLEKGSEIKRTRKTDIEGKGNEEKAEEINIVGCTEIPCKDLADCNVNDENEVEDALITVNIEKKDLNPINDINFISSFIKEASQGEVCEITDNLKNEVNVHNEVVRPISKDEISITELGDNKENEVIANQMAHQSEVITSEVYNKIGLQELDQAKVDVCVNEDITNQNSVKVRESEVNVTEVEDLEKGEVKICKSQTVANEEEVDVNKCYSKEIKDEVIVVDGEVVTNKGDVMDSQLKELLDLEKYEVDIHGSEGIAQQGEVNVSKCENPLKDEVIVLDNEVLTKNGNIIASQSKLSDCQSEINVKELQNLEKYAVDIHGSEVIGNQSVNVNKDTVGAQKSELELDLLNLETEDLTVKKNEVTAKPDEVSTTETARSGTGIKELQEGQDNVHDGEVIANQSEVTAKLNEVSIGEALGGAADIKQPQKGEHDDHDIEVIAKQSAVIDSKGEVNADKSEVEVETLINLEEARVDVQKSEVATEPNEVSTTKTPRSLTDINELQEGKVDIRDGEVIAKRSEVIVDKGEVTAGKTEFEIETLINLEEARVDVQKSEVATEPDEVSTTKTPRSGTGIKELQEGRDDIRDGGVIANLSEFTAKLNEVRISEALGAADIKQFQEGEDDVHGGEAIANMSKVPADKVELVANKSELEVEEMCAKQGEVNISEIETISPKRETDIKNLQKGKVAIHAGEVTVGNDEVAVDNDGVTVDKDEVTVNKDEVTVATGQVTVDTDEVNVSNSLIDLEDMTISKATVNHDEVTVNKNEVNVGQDEVTKKCKVDTCKSEITLKDIDLEKNKITAAEIEVIAKLDEVISQSEYREREVITNEGEVTVSRCEVNAAVNKIKLKEFLDNERGEVFVNKKEVSLGHEKPKKGDLNIARNEVTKDNKLNIEEKQENHQTIKSETNSEVDADEEHEVIKDKVKVEKSEVAVEGNGKKGDASKSVEPFLCIDNGEVTIDKINLHFIEKNLNDDIGINDRQVNTETTKTEKNDVSITKLNNKNIQNGIVAGKCPKWINDMKNAIESDVDLLNVFGNLNDNDNIKFVGIPELRSEEHAAHETKVEANKTDDISLLVENNPNYITEFLNHERQSNHLPNHTNPDKNSQYVNVDDITIKFVEQPEPTSSAGYVNTDELLNISTNNSQPEYVNIVQYDDVDEHLYDPVANDDYDALSDIRFTGPSDIQLMSTSFSESADIDEQDWDSGSDTRSSSSGEFIWKIASEKVTPMEDIEEVSSESSDEDEEGDSPEFVPSAWDKYATPTKSALRSPEKTLEKAEVQHKKPKGVWFKKQKYHCVYEYPREPESPSVNNYELWQPVSTSLIDWEVDTSPYVPTFDGIDSHPDCYQQLDKHTRNLYQLNDFTSGMTALDDEFFISSTARPFESYGGISSQFFPGQTTSDQWMDLTKQSNENITPDSGVEDITPAGNTDCNEFLQAPPKPQVQPLKLLASAALRHNQLNELKSNHKDSLGGLRHARNKLKLDLPPSPSAFTSTKAFTIEPPEEPVTKREVPTFTTFGKSRFLVQHVDTPTCDEENETKNVSFEALPYKPMQVKEDKAKVEVVRGEASLLDSADEDSGIESSTLERKKITNAAD